MYLKDADRKLAFWSGILTQVVSFALATFVFACPLPAWAKFLIVGALGYLELQMEQRAIDLENTIKRQGEMAWINHLTLRRVSELLVFELSAGNAPKSIDWRAAAQQAREDVVEAREQEVFESEISGIARLYPVFMLAAVPAMLLFRISAAYLLATVFMPS